MKSPALRLFVEDAVREEGERLSLQRGELAVEDLLELCESFIERLEHDRLFQNGELAMQSLREAPDAEASSAVGSATNHEVRTA